MKPRTAAIMPTLTSNPFGELHPIIREFIYEWGWRDLREFQKETISLILDTRSNVLLSSATASGKTEAAFLPVITDILKYPSASVAVLYISPLKALINDQYDRLGRLLEKARVPLTKWHGDASYSRKQNLQENPRGILQITPESLENIITFKPKLCFDMFCDLRFIIIDELHSFMSSLRGAQLMCLIERIQNVTGIVPRRIALSATIGNLERTKAWLSSGTRVPAISPKPEPLNKKISLSVRCFAEVADNELNLSNEALLTIYTAAQGVKSIIFTRTRREAESLTTNLRRLAEERHAPNIFRIHHGSLSKATREAAERDMKTSEGAIAIVATFTLELGIDVGSLDQIIHFGAPSSVSSFVQRMGRCGRSGARGRLLFVMPSSNAECRMQNAELYSDEGEADYDNAEPTAYDSLAAINFELIRTIATIELYVNEKWVEPADVPTLPYGLLYQQILAHIVQQGGEVSPADIARHILTMSAFESVTQDDLRQLLRHMVDKRQLMRTDRGWLMVGKAAEYTVASRDFCAIFKVPEEYMATHNGAPIGTIYGEPLLGAVLSLGGRTWRVLSMNEAKKTIAVEPAQTGGLNTYFEGVAGPATHDKVARMMRDVLESDKVYPYLNEVAARELAASRSAASSLGMFDDEPAVLYERKYALFPWVGTKRLRGISIALNAEGIGAYMMPEHGDSYYIEAECGGGGGRLTAIVRDILDGKVDKNTLPMGQTNAHELKYSEFIPDELLWKQYLANEVG